VLTGPARASSAQADIDGTDAVNLNEFLLWWKDVRLKAAASA